MLRRKLLGSVATGATLLAGCSTLDGQRNDDKIAVTNQRISVQNRVCHTETEDEATVSFQTESNQIRIKGTIATPRRCDQVFISSLSSRNERSGDKVIVSIGTEKPQKQDCERCEAELTYTVDLEFNRVPTIVQLEYNPAGLQTKSIGKYRRE